MGQQVKSAVSRRWGQGGGATSDAVELCKCWRNWENLFWMTGGRLEARGCVWGARAGCRGSYSGGGWGGRCVNLGQQCLCLTCKQEQKDIQCVHTGCISEETQTCGFTHISRTNCYRGLLVFVHKQAAHKTQRTSLLIKEHCQEAIHTESRETFTTAKQLLCPKDSLQNILKWIHLKLVSNITEPGHKSF